MIDSERLESLKQYHDYEEWRGVNTLKENLFIWSFFLSGDEFAGWHPYRIQTEESDEGIPYILSIWQRSNTDKKELLSVDIFDCESRIAAHESLLHLLGEFMSPLVQRLHDVEIGDVAFAGPADTMILFARANLILKIGHSGSELVSVAEIARQLDAKLIAQPSSTGVKVVSEILPPDLIELQDSIHASLTAGSLSPPESKRWYKLFTQSGEIYRENGRLMYRSTRLDSHEVRVFSVVP